MRKLSASERKLKSEEAQVRMIYNSAMVLAKKSKELLGHLQELQQRTREAGG